LCLDISSSIRAGFLQHFILFGEGEMTQNSNAFQYHIPLFGGKNYEYWCVNMRNFLISQDLWMLVFVGYTKPADQDAYNSLSIDQNT
jgi:hypothetical protein